MAEITEKHLWGWELEVKLKPIMEFILAEEMTKTDLRFDEIDFITDERYVELKGRPKISDKGKLQTRHMFQGWVVPADKVQFKDKPVTVFYYWDADQTLWRCDYDKEDWDTFNKGIPPWKSSQIHYWVPQDRWTLVYG